MHLKCKQHTDKITKKLNIVFHNNRHWHVLIIWWWTLKKATFFIERFFCVWVLVSLLNQTYCSYSEVIIIIITIIILFSYCCVYYSDTKHLLHSLFSNNSLSFWISCRRFSRATPTSFSLSSHVESPHTLSILGDVVPQQPLSHNWSSSAGWCQGERKRFLDTEVLSCFVWCPDSSSPTTCESSFSWLEHLPQHLHAQVGILNAMQPLKASIFSSGASIRTTSDVPDRMNPVLILSETSGGCKHVRRVIGLCSFMFKIHSAQWRYLIHWSIFWLFFCLVLSLFFTNFLNI